MDITASAGMEVHWKSPKYDGTTHYPEGDYCCSLNITIPATYSMFMVTMEMQSPSNIYESSGCTYDNIEYHSSSGISSTLCGNLGGQTWTEMMVYNAPLYFSFTWCSYKADGSTEVGFDMKVSGVDLMGRKIVGFKRN